MFDDDDYTLNLDKNASTMMGFGAIMQLFFFQGKVSILFIKTVFYESRSYYSFKN